MPEIRIGDTSCPCSGAVPGLSSASDAVTGASGYIGGRLLQLLERDPEVERVVALDLREPGVWPRARKSPSSATT